MWLEAPAIHIDVPDRIIHYEDLSITTASSGVSVTFDTPFTVPPSVVGTASSGDVAVISVTKTIYGFNAKAYNSSGTAITTNLDVVVKGY